MKKTLPYILALAALLSSISLPAQETYKFALMNDGAVEKHVPVVEVIGDVVKVKVGAVAHPMLPEHYIEWVSLQTKFGNQRKALEPGQAPEVCFRLCEGDEVEAVYAYCNLHSLFKA